MQPHPPNPHQAILDELIQLGTELARNIVALSNPQTPREAGPEPHPTADQLALAFDRVARAVRRTILLAQKLAHDTAEPPAAQTESRTAARKRILREVEDAIHRDAPAADTAALQTELRERIDAPDLEDDLATRPTADIIAEICRDLGLARLPGSRAWKRRTPADLAILAAHAALHPLPLAGEGRGEGPKANTPLHPLPPAGEGRGEGPKANTPLHPLPPAGEGRGEGPKANTPLHPLPPAGEGRGEGPKANTPLNPLPPAGEGRGEGPKANTPLHPLPLAGEGRGEGPKANTPLHPLPPAGEGRGEGPKANTPLHPLPPREEGQGKSPKPSPPPTPNTRTLPNNPAQAIATILAAQRPKPPRCPSPTG